MDSPLVTVLVPAYRAEAFIGDCLRSVANQTYPNLELIVVDDGSPDSTYEVARETVRGWPETTVLRNDVNVGNRENFRRMLGLGRGALVKFLCNDDMLEPDAVARLVAALEVDPLAVVATSRRQPVNESGIELPMDMLPQPPVETSCVVDGMAAGNHVLRSVQNWIGEPTTVLFRRGCLAREDLYELGGVAPQRNLDVVWWLKLLRRGRLAIVADSLSRFRLHPGQISRQEGRGPLVLAWHDIIVGAKRVGFLADPIDERSAWVSFIEMLQLHAGALEGSEVTRAAAIAPEIADRLRELCAA